MTLRSNEEYEGKTKELDADDLAVLVRELREDLFATRALLERAEAGEPVDQSLAYSILYMKEARLADFCKLLDIELDSAAERQARYADIRAANLRAHELEKEFGRVGSPKQTKAYVAALFAKVEWWWDREGFGHIREASYLKHGVMKLELSCSLFGDFALLRTTKPVSEKEAKAAWFAELEERGYDLVRTEGDRDPSLADTDNNRALLVETVRRAFPTARVTATSNHFDRKAGAILRDVTVHVYELDEVDALPEKPKEPS